jgi:phenylalanine ammonia-lyase
VIFSISNSRLTVEQLRQFVFQRSEFSDVQLDPQLQERVERSRQHLLAKLEKRVPIYGVSTGFGDSCFRFVDPKNGEILQANLISYLLCGSGQSLPLEACRAMLAIRLKSLSRGYSGVSNELIERMRLFLANDWIPYVPREGSLGASGDLIPLAYLAQCLQGEGQLHVNGQLRETADVLREAGLPNYTLKHKEGLALVNGTSAMAGLFLVNLEQAKFFLQLSTLTTAWLCLSLDGRTEPFDTLVNDRANQHSGQSQMAKQIMTLLQQESYKSLPLDQVEQPGSPVIQPVQDRYSLRCAPQILGPVSETLTLIERWLSEEINGTSDNPLLDDDGTLGMGGNFYGGYLSQGMDYLKISLCHIADMMDRQLAILIDEKSNRGLPANLANWPGLPEDQRHLHHGLKGLHQAVSAITSEIMAKAIPNGIFSRSSESHNQDKVSLGMSAAVQCFEMSEQVLTIFGHYMVCLGQALDLRGRELKGESSAHMYAMLREAVPFVTQDRSLDRSLQTLKDKMRAKIQSGWEFNL